MYPERFDTLARVYRHLSRRQVLRLVGTALGATLLSKVGRGEASAKCRQIGMACCAKKRKEKGQTQERKCCFGAYRDGRCQCIDWGYPLQ